MPRCGCGGSAAPCCRLHGGNCLVQDISRTTRGRGGTRRRRPQSRARDFILIFCGRPRRRERGVTGSCRPRPAGCASIPWRASSATRSGCRVISEARVLRRPTGTGAGTGTEAGATSSRTLARREKDGTGAAADNMVGMGIPLPFKRHVTLLLPQTSPPPAPLSRRSVTENALVCGI